MYDEQVDGLKKRESESERVKRCFCRKYPFIFSDVCTQNIYSRRFDSHSSPIVFSISCSVYYFSILKKLTNTVAESAKKREWSMLTIFESKWNNVCCIVSRCVIINHQYNRQQAASAAAAVVLVVVRRREEAVLVALIVGRIVGITTHSTHRHSLSKRNRRHDASSSIVVFSSPPIQSLSTWSIRVRLTVWVLLMRRFTHTISSKRSMHSSNDKGDVLSHTRYHGNNSRQLSRRLSYRTSGYSTDTGNNRRYSAFFLVNYKYRYRLSTKYLWANNW